MLRTLFATCSAALLAIAATACSAPSDNLLSPMSASPVSADSSKGTHLVTFKVLVWSTDASSEDDNYLEDAVVTLSLLPPLSGTQTATTEEPKGGVRFQIPNTATMVHLNVTYDGLCPFDADVPVDNPPAYTVRLWASCH
jgi:hypothetical protein